jgi:hypothetical protein
MAATIDWDVVEGWSVSKNRDGLEIVRPVCVRGIETDCTDGQNPLVLLAALTVTGMPTVGTALSTGYSSLLLEDYRVRTINSVDSVMVDLIYRQRTDDSSGGHGSANTWTITDSNQTSHLTTYATANGTQNTEVWYTAATGSVITEGDIEPPADARRRIVGVHKFKSNRVITASGRLRKDDWDSWKTTVRAAKDHINADTWGGATRGTWLFLGPTTRFFDRLNNPSSLVYVELTFVEEPDGHYPVVGYIDPQGIHPFNCATEYELRHYGGLPPVGGITRRRGKTLVSVQSEVAFSPLFAFSPGS